MTLDEVNLVVAESMVELCRGKERDGNQSSNVRGECTAAVEILCKVMDATYLTNHGLLVEALFVLHKRDNERGVRGIREGLWERTVGRTLIWIREGPLREKKQL